MRGYINIHEAARFLGGRSASWVRSHLHELPHRKLYDRLLFDPVELRAFVDAKAERRNPIDIDAIVRDVMGQSTSRRQDR